MIWKEPQIRIAHGRSPQVLTQFQNEWNNRSSNYNLSFDINDYSYIVDEIESKGFYIIPDFFKNIDTLAEKVQERFSTGNGTKNSEKESEVREINNHQIKFL